ncbi:hypothetical protein B0T22DRAFT_128447 [Podospora appendiculata]|uniref:Uncharacterized protein n=1 Tax=Podospora appendiculata TaxID=314037 RepID=A0AAE1CBH5_9PEZI|nr:hypothetical protein B0T22DRAFT_128447 [Podospora appendiculata]
MSDLDPPSPTTKLEPGTPPPSTIFPAAPPLGSLRRATLADIPRLATVAIASFFSADFFQWQFRHNTEYLWNITAFYEGYFTRMLLHPNHIVLVAEDGYSMLEDSDVQSIFVVKEDPAPPNARVIVGVGVWDLGPTSSRFGQFFPPPPESEEERERIRRTDEQPLGQGYDDRHGGVVLKRFKSLLKSSLSEHSTLDTLVVHPAYWRRGHGQRLVK